MEDEMGKVYSVSESGKKALELGLMTPEQELIVRIMLMVPRMTRDNCLKCANEAADRYGGVEEAIEAIKAGEVELTPIN